nr:SymE family type I addiction module toxin [Paraburkholderia hospita]
MLGELTMAIANLRARSHVTEHFVTIKQPRHFQRNWNRPLHLRTEPPLYPWMKLAGRWIETAGFAAGQRVRINVEHGRLNITAE